MPKRPPFMFRDEQQKRDCIVQSLQLAREYFPANPPNGIKDQTDLLIYLGAVFLYEQSLVKRLLKANPSTKLNLSKKAGVSTSADLKEYSKTEALLKKAADKFLADPTRTMMQLSAA